MKRTPRSHDAAIKALRAVAVSYQHGFIDPGIPRSKAMLTAAAYTLAADYLSSITGKTERAAGKDGK